MSWNISLPRVLYCFGIEVSPIVLLGASSILAALLTRKFRNDSRAVLLLGSAFSLLSVPLATSHTYVLAYPVVLASLDKYLSLQRPRSLVNGLLITVGIVAVHSIHGIGMLGDLPLPIQGFFAAIAVSTPIALALWVLIHNEKPEGSSE